MAHPPMPIRHVFCDVAGNILADGDSVTLIKNRIFSCPPPVGAAGTRGELTVPGFVRRTVRGVRIWRTVRNISCRVMIRNTVTEQRKGWLGD
jgi:hypothetical protein